MPNSSGGLGKGDFDYKGTVKNVKSLSTIKNPAVYKSVKQAIDRFDSVLGVRQREVKIGDLKAGTGGVHITAGGKSEVVVLSKSVFNGKDSTPQSIAAWAKSGYDSGHLTKTNKAVSHIVTHELAHATWNAHLTSPNAKAAAKPIEKMYDNFLKDKKKKGYGKYATTNVSEFWAEVCTKAVHGTADSYTRSAKNIIKKYGL